MKIAQIGYGYFGQIIIRDLKRHPKLNLAMVHDIHPEPVAKLKHDHPEVAVARSYEQILASDVEAVFIITPPETHYELTRRALLAGKHVYVEKPLTTNLNEAEKLCELAEEKGLTLFVDHIFLYSEPVRFLKKYVDAGKMGEIFYINARRVNLGLFQYKVDVIWDLAIHDISIVDHLIGFDIEQVSVFKKKYKNFPREAMANINADLVNGTSVNIQVSWLSPLKVREMVIGGSDKLVVYDHTLKNSIRVYDYGVKMDEPMDKDTLYRNLIRHHLGDVYEPELPPNTPLENAISHFLDCVQTGAEPLTGKTAILKTMRVLERIR